MFFAYLDDFGHCLENDWVFVLTGKAEFLAEIALANQDGANARYVRKYVG